MKISALTLLGCLPFLALSAYAKRDFTPPPRPNREGHGSEGEHDDRHYIKTGAEFSNGGAQMDMCPSGDCTQGQHIRLAMSRLEEITSSDKEVKNHKAETFASLDADWSSLQTTVIGGVNVTSTSFVTDLDVGPRGHRAGIAKFNLTASIFQGNTTVQNGAQSIFVPAGALKFTISLKDWPFDDFTKNKLRFAVTMKTRRPDGKEGQKPEKRAKERGDVSKIDRVDMGDGMFMDAPTEAVVDGNNVAITSGVVSSGEKVEYVWVFPAFRSSLFFDPLLATSQMMADSGADAGVPTPTPTNSSSKNSTKNFSPEWQTASTAVVTVGTLSALLLL